MANEEVKISISIKDLYKSYGKKQVLKGINLEVIEGELIGFIGRNGVGKSTTIDCMIGAKKFDKGTILVDGFDIRKNPLEAKYSYGYVASEPTCYEEMTGLDYLEFIASIYGLSEGEFKNNYKYLCNRLQLNLEELNNQIADYSHGMKQKLAIISAWIHEPKLIMMDEPFVGLDPKASHLLKEMMRETCNRGNAIFFSTHVLEVAEKLCDKVAIIKQGRLVKSGTMEDVKGDDSLEEVFLELEAES